MVDMLKMLKNFLDIQSSQLTTVIERMLIIFNNNRKIEIVQKSNIAYSRIPFSGFDTFRLMP